MRGIHISTFFSGIYIKLQMFLKTSCSRLLFFLNRLGHYTIPEETDEVCRWLSANLCLGGT